MRKLHANGYDQADEITAGLHRLHYVIERGDRILDLGCGNGRLVRSFRAHGFDAYGFDIHDQVEPGERSYFRFLDNPGKATSDFTLTPGAFALPFESETFDLVVSSAVLEHVLDMKPVVAEVARVLKPGGITVHTYPPRNALIEPHLYVPLASRIQSWRWLYFWARLGIRTVPQATWDARTTAEFNLNYCQTGMRYRRDQEMMYEWMPEFTQVRFIDDEFHNERGFFFPDLRRFLKALFKSPSLESLATARRMRVLFAQKRT